MTNLFSHKSWYFCIGLALLLSLIGGIGLLPGPRFPEEAISLAYYLVVPGWLISRLLIRRAQQALAGPHLIYALSFSLLYLMITGLGVNVLLPLLGQSRPLDAATYYPVSAAGIFVIGLISLRVRSLTSGSLASLVAPSKPVAFPGLSILAVCVATLFSVATIFGTIVLNNGGSNALTLVSLGILAITVAILIGGHRRIASPIIAYCLYALSLGLLLMYSLRSGHILGYDINKEFYVFQLAQSHGNWELSRYLNPYNACLSITILPTLLANLTHIRSEYIFKVVFQIIFAVVPLGIYFLFKQLTTKLTALLAVFIFIFQLYFVQQMPALARQEIAFLFLIAILLALFTYDRVGAATSKQSRMRIALLLIFSLGMLLSHYSTSYFWLFTLLIFYALRVVIPSRFLKGIPRDAVPKLSYIAIFALSMVAWYGQLTNTGNNFSGFLHNLPQALTTTLSGDSLSQSVNKLELQSSTANAQSNLSSAYTAANTKAKDTYNVTNPIASSSQYSPQLTSSSGLAGSVNGPVATILSNLLEIISVVMIYGLEVVGIILILVARKNNDPKAKQQPQLKSLMLLGFSSLVIVGVIVIAPSLSVEYNLSRAYMQALTLTALAGAYALAWVFRGMRGYIAPAVCIGVFVLFLSYNTGASFYLFGGPALVTTANSGFDYDKFYTTDGESVAAQWLAAHRDHSAPVYADVFAALKLQSQSGIVTARNDLYPTAVGKHSYVFLSATNTQRNITFATSGTNELEYQAPTDQLESQENTIYASQDATILR